MVLTHAYTDFTKTHSGTSSTSELAEKILLFCSTGAYASLDCQTNTQHRLTHSSGITAPSLSLFFNHCRIFTDTPLRSASKCFHNIHSESRFLPIYLMLFLSFPLPSVFFFSVFTLWRNQREICVCVCVCQLLYLHTHTPPVIQTAD